MDDFFLTRHKIKFTDRTKGLCVLADASLVAHNSLQKEVLVVLHRSVYFNYWQCRCRVPAKGGKQVFPVSCSRVNPAASRQSAGVVQKDTLHCIAYWVQMLIEAKWFTSSQTLLLLFLSPHQLVI